MLKFIFVKLFQVIMIMRIIEQKKITISSKNGNAKSNLNHKVVVENFQNYTHVRLVFVFRQLFIVGVNW